MEDEFNDLSTDNIATSFDNSPDNIATSDETSASEYFDHEHTTEYSKNKKGKVLAVAALSLTMVTGILSGKSNINPFVKKMPTVSDVSVTVSANEDSLNYQFTTTNTTKYLIDFAVTVDSKEVFTLDVTTSNAYSGKVEKLGYNVTGKWALIAHNNVDFYQTLQSGDFTTPSK